jgi:hypothetical protein
MADAAEAAGGAGKASKSSQLDDLLAKEQQGLDDMAKTSQTDALPKKNPMAAPSRPLAEIEADLARAQGEAAGVKDIAGDIAQREGASGLGGVRPGSTPGISVVQRKLEEVIADLETAAGKSPAELDAINQARAASGLPPVEKALAEAEDVLNELRDVRTRIRDLEAERLRDRGIEVPEVPWPRDK